MKDWKQALAVGIGLFGLIITLHLQTQSSNAASNAAMEARIGAMEARIGARFDQIDSRIETVDARVYDLSQDVTRVVTLILESDTP